MLYKKDSQLSFKVLILIWNFQERTAPKDSR